MHLSPIDIENVAKLNIAQKLERRRQSVQLVQVTAAKEKDEGNHLKLPPAPRRKSLGGHCRGGSLRLKMPCPSFGVFPSSAPFLPFILPKASSGEESSVPLLSCANSSDCLLKRRSAFSCALPQLPLLFLTKTESKYGTKGEANGTAGERTGAKVALQKDELISSFSANVSSVVSSCGTTSHDELAHQSPLISTDQPPPLPPINAAAEVIKREEEETVENSLLAFARAQQKLAEHRAQLDQKLDVVSCHRMAVELVDELLDRLHHQMCHSPQSNEENEEKEIRHNKTEKTQLTIAEVQRDFFPYVYAKAEQLFVDRMTNSYLNIATPKLDEK